MAKVKIIQMKVSEEQNNLIGVTAKKLGIPKTTFCRFVILQKINSEETQNATISN